MKLLKGKHWIWIVIAIVVVAIIGIVFGERDTTNTPGYEETNLDETDNNEIPENIVDVDYLTLYENKDDYHDKWVRVYGSVSSNGTNISDVKYITFHISGVTKSVYCNLKDDQEVVDEGVYVAIVGKVGTNALGTLNVDNCYIDITGEEAESKYNDIISQKEAAEQAAEQKAEEERKESEQKARTDFINSCSEYQYEDIARNPDDYEDQKAKFTGKVIEVVETGDDVILRVNVTATENQFAEGGYLWDDTIYIEYTRKSESESRILEDDIITMYGTLNGIKTYESILSSSVSIPWLIAEYIDIQQ